MNKKNENLNIMDQKLKDLLEHADLRFRYGFSERTTTRILNILKNKSLRSYYADLSSLLPKMLYISAMIFIFILFSLYILTGEINLQALTGNGTPDENNFISYLIMYTK